MSTWLENLIKKVSRLSSFLWGQFYFYPWLLQSLNKPWRLRISNVWCLRTTLWRCKEFVACPQLWRNRRFARIAFTRSESQIQEYSGVLLVHPIWNARGAILLPALLLWFVLCMALLAVSAFSLRAQHYTAGIFRTEVCALKIAQKRAQALTDLESIEKSMRLPRSIVKAARTQTLLPGIGIISLAQAELAKRALEIIASQRELKLRQAQAREYLYSCAASSFNRVPATCSFAVLSKRSFTERADIFPDLPAHWERRGEIEKSEFTCRLAGKHQIHSKAWLRLNPHGLKGGFEISLAPFILGGA